MNVEDLKEMTRDPNFISGIYNYCDRWCERCAFTSCCAVFAMGIQQTDARSTCDVDNEAFWQSVQESLHLAFALLHEIAEEREIDLDSLDIDAEMEEQRRIEERARNHELARTAAAYAGMVDTWFDSNEEVFAEAEEELNVMARLNIVGAEPYEKAISIQNAARENIRAPGIR